MNIGSRFKYLLFAFFLHMHSSQKTTIHIKVLLKNITIENDSKSTKTPLADIRCTFSSNNGLVLSYSQEPQKKYFFKEKITARLLNKKIVINNKKNDSNILRITALDSHVLFDNNTYLGTFYLHKNQNNLEIINKLPLEDYVDSVLKTEGWPGWTLETYKIFAITCRTYAIYQMQQARKKKQHYHVKPTNAHQTYYGIHSCPTIKEAIKQTEGVFLSYKNKPILAMFDSCCGGIIPAQITNTINFKEAPYLARTYPCTHCKGLKIYSWNKDFTINNLRKNLQVSIPHLKTITDIITQKDKAGVVKTIIVKDGKKQFKLDGKKLYSLLPEIKSFAFTCTKRKNNITIKGRGYGHHLGLCQWGANELVKKKWPYKRILNFYYPGTSLMKLKPKKNSKI